MSSPHLQTSRGPQRSQGRTGAPGQVPGSARRSRSPHPAASVGAAATPHLPARGRARTPVSSDSPRAGSRSLFPPPTAVPPHAALTCLGRGPWRRGTGGSEAGEEGGAALRARHRSTMAELGAGGDGHRGGDGAVRSETGDCTAGASGGPAGGEAGAASRMGGLAPGTSGTLLRRTAARNGRPRAPRTRTRSAPALRPPPSAARRPPGSAVPPSRGRPAGPSSGRPSYAPPRLSPQQVETRQRARAGGGTGKRRPLPSHLRTRL